MVVVVQVRQQSLYLEESCPLMKSVHSVGFLTVTVTLEIVTVTLEIPGRRLRWLQK